MTSKETVISNLQKHLSVSLKQSTGKQIIYSGVDVNGKKVTVCTPESKLHIKGHGWIDITIIQKSLLEKSDFSILALRMGDDKTYYVDFKKLVPYLTHEAMVNNKKEGDHWKLYVWPDHLEVRGNSKHLDIAPNNLNDLNGIM